MFIAVTIKGELRDGVKGWRVLVCERDREQVIWELFKKILHGHVNNYSEKVL
jgi:hypothetical protein